MDFLNHFFDFINRFSHELRDLRLVGQFGEARDEIAVDHAFGGKIVTAEGAVVPADE